MYLENHSEALAEAGWREFQAIEAEGGIVEALRSGKLQKHIASAAAAREKNIAKRKDALTGVSEFPNLNEAPVPVESLDLSAIGASVKKRKTVSIPEELQKKLHALELDAWIEAADSGASLASMTACLGSGEEKSVPWPCGVWRKVTNPFATPAIWN